MEPQSLFLSLQEIATGSYTEPGEYSPHCLIALHFNIILPSSRRSHNINSFFTLGSLTKILYLFPHLSYAH
jgi:hypothetical protein